MADKRTKHYLVGGCLSALVLLLCLGGWMLYEGISTALRAERALHAVNLATRLVDQYVQEEGKSWRFERFDNSPSNDTVKHLGGIKSLKQEGPRPR